MTRKLALVQPSTPSPLVRAVDDFLASARADGVSAKTIKTSYGFALKHVFLPWAADHDIRQPGQLDSRTLNQFSAHLMDVGGKNGALKPASVWTYQKAVKRLLAYLKEEGEAVSGDMKLTKIPQRLVVILTPQEIDRMEQAAQSERDKLIVRVLAETGLRRAELTGLKVRDLLEDSGRNYLLVHGKGSRDRKVPMTPRIARRLRRLINGRGKDEHVFLALRKQDGAYEPLSESGVTQMVTALGEQAGIDKHVTPHLFRHTAATFLLRQRMDSLLVAQVLGHSSLAMIQRVYSHLSPTDAHVAVMRALTGANDDD